MIRKLLVRLLKFFVKLGFIGKVVSFRYTGKGLSLNKFYSQGHWTVRNGIANEYKSIFNKIILPAKNKVWMDRFYLLIFYNSRLDVDNVVGMEKVFTDCLKGVLVQNDGRKNYRGMMIFCDDNLPPNTFEFIMIEEKNGNEEPINKRHRAKADKK